MIAPAAGITAAGAIAVMGSTGTAQARTVGTYQLSEQDSGSFFRGDPNPSKATAPEAFLGRSNCKTRRFPV